MTTIWLVQGRLVWVRFAVLAAASLRRRVRRPAEAGGIGDRWTAVGGLLRWWLITKATIGGASDMTDHVPRTPRLPGREPVGIREADHCDDRGTVSGRVDDDHSEWLDE